MNGYTHDNYDRIEACDPQGNMNENIHYDREWLDTSQGKPPTCDYLESGLDCVSESELNYAVCGETAGEVHRQNTIITLWYACPTKYLKG